MRYRIYAVFKGIEDLRNADFRARNNIYVDTLLLSISHVQGIQQDYNLHVRGRQHKRINNEWHTEHLNIFLAFKFMPLRISFSFLFNLTLQIKFFPHPPSLL